MGAENLRELEKLISAEADGRRIVSDLKDLRLVDQTLSVLLRNLEFEGMPSIKLMGGCVLRIQRSANGEVIFKISGRIEVQDVQDLRELLALETPGQQLVLDLRDVTLVNEEAVKFLASCEADTIEIANCPLYIRKWIEEAKGGNRRRRKQ